MKMRNVLMMAATLALCACGLTQDNFGEKFGDKYCQQAVECEMFADEAACHDASTSEDDPTAGPDCDFQADKAADCLDGEFTCQDILGTKFAVPPAVCGQVCGDTTQ